MGKQFQTDQLLRHLLVSGFVIVALIGSVGLGIAAASTDPTTTHTQTDRTLGEAQVSPGVVDTSVLQQSERIEITSNDTYSGGSGSGDQAITMRVTLTAQQQSSGITVRFDNTRFSFVDYESFNVTVSDVEWNKRAPGVYNVTRLDAGESITFTFKTYPRTLDQNNLDVVDLSVDAANPQTYSQSPTLSADMSNSPLIGQNGDGSGGISILSIAALVVGTVGVAVAGYTRFTTGNDADERLEEVYEALDRKVADPKALRTIRETFDDHIDTEDIEDDGLP